MSTKLNNSLNIQSIHDNGNSSVTIGLINDENSVILQGEAKSGMSTLKPLSNIPENNNVSKIIGTVSESDLRKNLLFGIKKNIFDLDRSRINKSFFYNDHVITCTNTVVRNIDIITGTNRRITFENNIDYVSFNNVASEIYVKSNNHIYILDRSCETTKKDIDLSTLLSDDINNFSDFVIGNGQKISLFGVTDNKITKFISYDINTNSITDTMVIDNYYSENEELEYRCIYLDNEPVILVLRSNKTIIDIYNMNATYYLNQIDSSLGNIIEILDNTDNCILIQTDNNKVYRCDDIVSGEIGEFVEQISEIDSDEKIVSYFNNGYISNDLYDNLTDDGYIGIKNNSSSSKIQIYRSWNGFDYRKNYTKDLYIELDDDIKFAYLDSIVNGNLVLIHNSTNHNISTYSINREELSKYISEYNTRINSLESSVSSNTSSINNINNTIKQINTNISNINKPISYKTIPVNEQGLYDIDLIREEGWYQTTVVGDSLLGAPGRLPNERFTILAIPLYSTDSMALLMFSDDTNSSPSRENKAVGYKFINNGVASDWYQFTGLEWKSNSSYSLEGYLKYINGKIVDSGFNENSFINVPNDYDETKLISYNGETLQNTNVSYNRFIANDVGYEELDSSTDPTVDNLVLYIDSENIDGKNNPIYFTNSGTIYNLVDNYDPFIINPMTSMDDGSGIGEVSGTLISDKFFDNDTTPTLASVLYNPECSFTIEFSFIFNDSISNIDPLSSETLLSLGEGIYFQKFGYFTRFFINGYRTVAGEPYANYRYSDPNSSLPINFSNKRQYITIVGNNSTMEYKIYYNGVLKDSSWILSYSVPDSYKGCVYGYDSSSEIYLNQSTIGSLGYLKIYNRALSDDEVKNRYNKRLGNGIVENDFIDKKYQKPIIDHINKNINDILYMEIISDKIFFPNMNLYKGMRFKVTTPKILTSKAILSKTVNVNGIDYQIQWEPEDGILEDLYDDQNSIEFSLSPDYVFDIVYDGTKFICLNFVSKYSDLSHKSGSSDSLYNKKLTSENIDLIKNSKIEKFTEIYYADSGNSCTGKPSGVDSFTLLVDNNGQLLKDSNNNIYTRISSGADIFIINCSIRRVSGPENTFYISIDVKRSDGLFNKTYKYSHPNTSSSATDFYVYLKSFNYNTGEYVFSYGPDTSGRPPYYGQSILWSESVAINLNSTIDYSDKIYMINGGDGSAQLVEGLYSNWEQVGLINSENPPSENSLISIDQNNKIVDAEKTIDGVDINTNNDVVHFGICTTIGSAATKTVTLSGFKLINGARVFIKFNNANTYIGTTYLNINNTGDKQISVLSNDSNNTSGKIGLLSNRIYEFIYYNNSYYAINTLSYYPAYNKVYGPQSNNRNINHLSYITAGSKFSSLYSSGSTLLLPGNYNLTTSSISIKLQNHHTITGYTEIIKPTSYIYDRDINDVSICSKISVSNPTHWPEVMNGASYYIKNIIFDLSNDSADDSSVGLYSDYGLFQITGGSCVKFKNCVFNVRAERAFLIENGSIEFENCAFFLAPGETVCHHFIDAICSSTTDEINIKFTNCYFVSEVTSGHAYTSALAGYNVNLTIENCELINVDPFKVEYSNLSNTNGGSNILIRNNKIKTNAIGAYDASSGGYTNGSLIFSNNLVESDEMLEFYVQGGSQSMISNNTFNLEGSYVSILYYARSSSAMTNSFVGNTSNSRISLSKLNSGSAYITVTGNCINGKLDVTGFTKSSQGYNVNT